MPRQPGDKLSPFELLERRFADSQSVANIGSFEWDLTTGAIWWSDQTYRIYGIEPSGSVPTLDEVRMWLRDDMRDDVVATVRDAVARGADWAMEFPIVRGDGTERWLSAVGHMIVNDAGDVLRAIGTAQDVTEARSAQQHLRRAERIDALAHIAPGFAHDLNNLLTAIVVSAELLNNDDANAPHIARIHNAALSAGRLGAQLSSLNRDAALFPRPVDLAALIREMHGRLAGIVRSNIELTVHCTSVPTTINIDPSQIEQIVFNLGSNALEAMPQGGQLNVVVEHAPSLPFNDNNPEHGWAVLRFVDNGPGMPPSVEARAFEPFYTTKGDAGTGLGLASARDIALENGGDILLSTEFGSGCDISVFVPCVDPALAPKPSRSSRAKPSGSVLIVDSDIALLGALPYLLERNGLICSTASSIEEAMEILRAPTSTIDMVLTELILPGGGAVELRSLIERDFPGLALGFMSGFSSSVTNPALLGDPASVLRKPFTEEQLLEALSDLLPGSD